jgi:UDP-N-acetylglucosamine--N-acetylmuramyl-(pentapeptide) pyrophosphoryl-undecaprenol N-acetylglucosamine transferase
VSGLVLLAAGGTGGHLFPAEALALTLKARGWRVHLATDHRVETYGHDFPAEQIHYVRSATLSRSPLDAVRALGALALGYVQARVMVGRLRPDAAVGFGGYPTVPPMLAAAHSGAPTIIHEQNAVLGRANKFLAPRVSRIATSFAAVGGAEQLGSRLVQTGNPVRPAVLAAAAIGYQTRAMADPFRLLVFGGSQGARFFSDLMPATVALIPKELQKLMSVVQQCRPEDIARVRQGYELLGVRAELEAFFPDLPEKVAESHLVVSRSGASTCTELAVIGRPAIMVPLPHALDQDQKANANVLAGAGGGWVIDQAELTAARLAGDITRFIKEPERLATAAAAARSMARPDAVERLADLVERVASEKSAPAKVPA